MADDQPNERWTRLQIITLAICFVLMMIDGADVLIVSFAAPVLMEQWGVDAASFGLVFSGGLIGMIAGSTLLAPFADVYGRKPILIVATVIIAIGMLLSALAADVWQLIFLRLATGLGIGAILATTTSLASEFSPRRFVPAAVMIVAAGFPAGAMLAGVVANLLLLVSGWQSLFVAAGLCSVAMAPVVLLVAPESVRFLLDRQQPGDVARANELLAAQGLGPLRNGSAPTRPSSGRIPMLQLLHRNVRLGTLLLWSSFFSGFFTLYFLLSWIPRIAVDSGYPLATAIFGSSVMNVGAVVGLFLLGWIASLYNLGKVVAMLFGAAMVTMVTFAYWNTPEAVFYGLLFMTGFCVQGGFGGMYAAAAEVYDSRIRTTGVGWAIGVGRLGAVVGPAAGGIALAAGLSVKSMFVLFAMPLFVTALCLLALGRSHFSK